jgi:hypothetical protein
MELIEVMANLVAGVVLNASEMHTSWMIVHEFK